MSQNCPFQKQCADMQNLLVRAGEKARAETVTRITVISGGEQHDLTVDNPLAPLVVELMRGLRETRTSLLGCLNTIEIQKTRADKSTR